MKMESRLTYLQYLAECLHGQNRRWGRRHRESWEREHGPEPGDSGQKVKNSLWKIRAAERNTREVTHKGRGVKSEI